MLKKILYIIQTIVLAFILWNLTSATYENIYIKREVRNFMKRGVLDEELSSTFQKLYRVPRETWQEKIPAYSKTYGRFYPGSPGDLLVALDSPFKNMPIINEGVSFFVGGHAAICAYAYDDNLMLIRETDIIDISGLNDSPEDNNVESDNKLYWMDYDYKNRFIGIRVKATEEQKKIAFNEAVSYIGDPYNYSFLFNTKIKHYCSDIMSKAYAAAGIDLNKDGFVTTVLDLIVSAETYIFMYKYTDSDLVDHIYFIDDL